MAIPPQRGSLNENLAFGAAWMIGARLALRGIGLASTVVLARLLLPEDYGVVALALMILGLLQMFSEFGFDLTLIQNQTATREHYDTVWTLSMLRGLLLAAVTFLSAGWVAAFFGEPRVEPVMQALALLPLMLDSINPGTADFRKHLNFRMEFLFLVAPRLIRLFVTILLAVLWRNHWALVVGVLCSGALRLAGSFLLHDFRPRLSLAVWRRVIGFSQWLLLSTVMEAIRQKAGGLVLAKFGGTGMLSIYTVGSELANLVTSELVAPIRRAVFPGYAKMADDRQALLASVAGAYGLLCIIAIPTAVGIGLTADHMVQVLLGENWLATIPFIQVLVVAGAIMACRGLSKPVYIASGRPEISGYISTVEALLFAAAIAAGYLALGPIGVAWGTVAVELVMLLCDVALLRVLVGLPVSAWFARAWRPAIAAGVMGLAVAHLGARLPAPAGFADHAAHLALSVGLGGGVYALALSVLWGLSGRSRAASEWALVAFLHANLLQRVLRRPARAA